MRNMRLLRNVPIKRKLIAITMLTSGVALLLACVAFMVYDTVVFRGEMATELTSTARIVGDNSSSALAFRDPDSARQTLQSLKANVHIVGAAIYDTDGNVFAAYKRARLAQPFASPALAADGIRFDGGYLRLFRGIELAGERVGTVYIQSDLGEVSTRLRRYVFIVALVMIAASAVALFLSKKLQATISAPISHLAGIANLVATQKDYSVRANKQDEDELGLLIDGFNEMLNQIQERDAALQSARDDLERRVQQRTQELESAHKQLLVISRQAGMAEVATGVLHNVGNVLNSVNVSATLVADSVRHSKAAGLARAVALLKQHEQDLGAFVTLDAQGRHLPAYLAQLSEQLRAEQQSTIQELELLRSNIEHIKDIVTMQQSYATISGVKEVVDVAVLVEDSLRLHESGMNRHGIAVVRDFQAAPALNLDKHKVLQILVNLVRNAKHACTESERTDKQITLRVRQVDSHVDIAVIDNGVGIAPENLTRIFAHGFTTRKDGHGFGLHSGALAARELGGALTVHSDGIGRGAIFTLALPVEAAHA